MKTVCFFRHLSQDIKLLYLCISLLHLDQFLNVSGNIFISVFLQVEEDNRVAPWVAVGKMCRMTLPRVLGDVTMTSMAPSGSLRHPEPTPQNCHPPLTNRRRPKTSPTKPNQTKRNTSQTSPNSKLFYMAPKRVDPEQMRYQ